MLMTHLCFEADVSEMNWMKNEAPHGYLGFYNVKCVLICQKETQRCTFILRLSSDVWTAVPSGSICRALLCKFMAQCATPMGPGPKDTFFFLIPDVLIIV